MDWEEKTQTDVKMPPLVRTKKRKLTPWGYAAIIVFLLLCLSFGFWLGGRTSTSLIPPEGDTDLAFQTPDFLNVLLLGSDQRKNEPARADTLILAAVDLKEREIHLVSIPRDTRVLIPTKGVIRKINYAHAVGGAELTVKTVEQFLQLPVHYYVETNFMGFSEIIDTLGGVTINVEERMYKPLEGIDLQPGIQKLNGPDALSYVRWRGDGRGDLGRIERQQKFIHALADQALKFSTLWKIPELIEEVKEYVGTDMKLKQMIALGNKFKNFEQVKMYTYQVPGETDDINYGGSYFITDQKELEKLLQKIYEKEENGEETGT